MSARILVLGGTGWLSGAVARAAVARGHDVTCLARGRTGAGAVPDGARLVVADRDAAGAYDEVAATGWDEIVDVSSTPGHLRAAVAALAARARHWTYVSSLSAYAADDTPGADESAATHEPLVADTWTDMEQYGPAKAACEQAVLDAAGDRALLARAGLIGGPGDRSDRFGYWPARFAAAGAEPVLAVDPDGLWSQTIDARDLAAWLVAAAEDGVTGPFNAVGEQVPLAEVYAQAREAAGHRGDLVLAPADWLVEQGVAAWMGPESLPLWVPGEENAGFAARSDAAALAAGLRRRPHAELVADTLAWERELGVDREPRRAGLTRARERALLATYAARP